MDEGRKKGLNSKVYTEESYKKLENTVKTAEEVYSGEKALQAEELRDLCETLSAALETVKSSVKDSGCKLVNCEFGGDWISNGEITLKGDIVNYSSKNENVLLITASYENGILIDTDLQEFTIDGLNSVGNITSNVPNIGAFAAPFLYAINQEALTCFGTALCIIIKLRQEKSAAVNLQVQKIIYLR